MVLLNLLSGIFGRSDAKSTEKRAQAAHEKAESENRSALAHTDEIRRRIGHDMREKSDLPMREMVAAAEANGFNPLTVLRAGGLGHAYSAFFERERYYEPSATYQTTAAPVHHIPSMGSVITGALEKTAAQLGSAFAGGAGGGLFGGGTPLTSVSYGSSIRSVSGGAAALSRSPTAAIGGLVAGRYPDGMPYAGERGDLLQTNPLPHGMRVDPESWDADSWEAFGGEILGEIGGVKNAIDAGFLNLTGTTKADRRTWWSDAFNTLSGYRTTFTQPPGTGGSFGGQTNFSTGGQF